MMLKMQIIDVTNAEIFIREVAEVLLDGFTTSGIDPWEDLNSAIQEVCESLLEDRISRACVDDDGNVLGWISGFHEYAFVWELHPLVVRSDVQIQGVGTALVRDFEHQVKLRGGMTIRLGTDDENKRTSIGGVDLYPNVLENIANIRNLRRHPFEFYQKLGYEITGIIPDANGYGKPDIIMCKRV
jgi:aminoglycoside 6'-N-acetyltransferase I